MEWREPSEKESGVKFRMAIMWVRRVGDWDAKGGRWGDKRVRGESGEGDFGRESSWL